MLGHFIARLIPMKSRFGQLPTFDLTVTHHVSVVVYVFSCCDRWHALRVACFKFQRLIGFPNLHLISFVNGMAPQDWRVKTRMSIFLCHRRRQASCFGNTVLQALRLAVLSVSQVEKKSTLWRIVTDKRSIRFGLTFHLSFLCENYSIWPIYN